MAEAASGVTEGSVLGPFLFVIYVNDLSDYLTINYLLFSDDVKLIAPRKQADALQSSKVGIGSLSSTLPKVSTSPLGILPIRLHTP